METQRLEDGITAGSEFLRRRQRPSGQFCLQSSVEPSHPEGTSVDTLVFLTACVAYCLLWVPGAGAREVRRRAVDALAAEVDGRGLGRYFAREQAMPLPLLGRPVPLHIVPDLDTSACAAFMLERDHGRRADPTPYAASRTPEGLFPTWLRDEPPALDDALPFVYMVPSRNDVCCGINANVLLALGECDVTQPAVAYLQRVFAEPCPEEQSDYYTDEVVLSYMYSRAYHESAPSLGTAREAILKRLLSQRQPDGSYGTELRTALALCVLANFGAWGYDQEATVRFLLRRQREDGSWPSGSFYTWERRKTPIQVFLWYAGVRRELRAGPGQTPASGMDFGSVEVTTAYCLEALSRFTEGR